MPVPYTFTHPADAPLDPGASRKHEPKVLMAEFGDGFSQRAAEGPNNDPITREFSWTNLDEAEMTAIDNFFIARNGWQSFNYNHRGTGNKVYICKTWTVVDVDYNAYTVTATFTQVFDLA
jgi:phage-related protein